MTLLWQAPARWLTGAVQQASQGRVTFQQVRGTVWQGSGRVTLTGGAGSLDAATLPGRLSWQLRPALTGLAAELTAECCTQAPWRIGVQPRWNGAKVVVADSLSQWPALLLSGLGTPWNTVQPEGQLILSTQGLVMEWAQGRMVLAGRAQLDAQHLSSRLSTLKPMGSYRLILQGGATPGFSLETLEGSLLLVGPGSMGGRPTAISRGGPRRPGPAGRLVQSSEYFGTTRRRALPHHLGLIPMKLCMPNTTGPTRQKYYYFYSCLRFIDGRYRPFFYQFFRASGGGKHGQAR